MKITLLFSLSLIFIKSSIAQDTTKAWKVTGFASLSANQVTHSNWAEGGDNTTEATALFNLTWRYKKYKHLWIGSIDLGYGLVKEQGVSLRKNEDKIDLDMKYDHLIKKNIYYGFLFNFKSQFAPGYDYPNDSVKVSNFLAPGYITLASGIDYMPDEYFSVFVSPVAGKLTVVNDQRLADEDKFGVAPAQYDANGNKIVSGNKLRAELGALVSVKYQKDVAPNINLFSKLSLFNNYSDKDKADKKNIDVNWQLRVTVKINSFFSANLFMHLVYENDVNIVQYQEINGVQTVVGNGPRLQFQELLGLGLSYKF